MNYLLSTTFAISFVFLGYPQTATQAYSQGIVRPQATEQQLRQEYISFLKRLDAKRIVKDYPASIRDIQSRESRDRKRGLAVLGASGDVDAIAWIAPLVESDHGSVRAYAGMALEKIVSGYELRRRDPLHPEKIVILPRSASDLDLRPLAWLILKMMRLPDDGNTAAYAATMVGYLGLPEFAEELRRLLKSRHPAVRHSAGNALTVLNVK